MRRSLKAGICVLACAAAALLIASGAGQWFPDEPAPTGPLLTGSGERVTVDVRNAGGVSGMAREATNHLREAGFDVVNVGNASTFDQDSTVVIDRVGSLQKAAAVAEALGVRLVVSEPDPGLFVDVTVRLGAGWKAPARAGQDAPPPSLVQRIRDALGLGRP